MYKPTVCVVGLGYVGLPLAVGLAEHFTVYGFDIKKSRIQTLQNSQDPNREVTSEALKAARLTYSSDPAVIGKAEFVIVAVPTPIDKHQNPDLSPLYSSSELVGRFMQKGTIVVYESTVYPLSLIHI